MLTLAAFRTRRPEFAEAAGYGDPLVQAALDAAEAETDAEVFGTATDDAHMWLTAHKLSVDPAAKDARLKGEGFGTLYLAERQRLETMCGAAWMGALDAAADGVG